MVYLDRNESQFGPSPQCFEILRNSSKKEISNYSRDFARGVKSILSEALAREYNLAESNVLLSYGSEDMLKQIVHCYLTKNDVIMVPQHSWWYYKAVANEVEAKVIEYPMHADDSHFYYNLNEVIALVSNVKPRFLLFASPNNPTGNSLSMENINLLLNGCGDTMIVIDEAYFGFTDTAPPVTPRLTYICSNLAVLRTFSKLYGLAGMRIGYAFVGKNYQKLITYSARYLGYNLLSEQLALTTIRDTGYYRSLAVTVAKERERYYEFFRTIEGCKAYRSDANFVLVKLPIEDNSPLKKYLSLRGIEIKFFSEKEFPGHVRITIGTSEQNTLLIDAMKHYFAQRCAEQE